MCVGNYAITSIWWREKLATTIESIKERGVLIKVVNSVSFRLEWPKHFIPIQKIEQFSSHFKSRSVLDFSAKFQPEYSDFIPHVPFRS